MQLKIPSAKLRPFCPGGDELILHDISVLGKALLINYSWMAISIIERQKLLILWTLIWKIGFTEPSMDCITLGSALQEKALDSGEPISENPIVQDLGGPEAMQLQPLVMRFNQQPYTTTCREITWEPLLDVSALCIKKAEVKSNKNFVLRVHHIILNGIKCKAPFFYANWFCRFTN